MLDVKIETEDFKDVYEVASEIGRGKFAVVKECLHRKSESWYAAKVIRKRRKGVDCRAEVLQEVSMLQATLSHPHFVDLIEVYETRHEMIIITELMRGGELFQHITTEGQLEEGYTQTIMRQVLSGLSFLHSQQIAHLDIKPQNILLSNESLGCKIKLCDLGLARNVNRADIFEIIGTPDYLAPEILDYQKLSVACDMWSTGVLAYVMLSGYSPFAGDTKQETYLNISQVNLDFPPSFFANVSSTAVQFIQKLLIKEPGSRLKVDECLSHTWLTPACPHSPNEHEPVKRIRFEEHLQPSTEPHTPSKQQPTDTSPSDQCVAAASSPAVDHEATAAPATASPHEEPTLIEEDAQKPIEKESQEASDKTTDHKSSKETFKSELKFTPCAPVASLKLPPSSGTRQSPARVTPVPSPRCSIKLPRASSPSFSTILTPIPAARTRSFFSDMTNTDGDDHDSTHLSAFSPQPTELQSSELTPHLSRTSFWKDSSSEPSGISV